MIVPEGGGAVIEKSRETGTERIAICVNVFVSGPDAKINIHFPPTGRFGYENEQLVQTAAKVTPSLGEPGDTSQCSGVIVVNMIGGGDFGKVRRNDWERLMNVFKEHRITDIRVQEVPLEETITYQFPEFPNHVLVMGTRQYKRPNGQLGRNSKERRYYWIPIGRDGKAEKTDTDMRETDEDRTIQEQAIRRLYG